MLTILYANHKGGAGKTTLAHHQAEYFAEQGLRVLAVDTDPQGNLYRRLARIEHTPAEYPPVSFAKGCICMLSPRSWQLPDNLAAKFDVAIVDTAPGDTLVEGPKPDVVVVPVDGIDAALGAGNVIDRIRDADEPPLVLLVKNGTSEGGRKLQRTVSDLQGSEGIEICAIEIPRGGCIHRSAKTCKPAWRDTYGGSSDAKAMRACCRWLAERVVG